jgi:hypothetical protein
MPTSDTYTTFLQEPEPKDREQSVESYIKARLQSLDKAIGGYTSVSLQGLSGNVDLTPTQAKHRVIKLTGAPSGAVTVRIPATTGANADIHFVNTCTGGSSTITVKSTGANAGNASGVSLPTGRSRQIRHDGESAYAAGVQITTATGVSTEEGNWTPVLTIGGSSAGITYTMQQGTYDRVGNQVTARCRITLSSKGGLTGAVLLAGLPYAAQNPEATSSAPYVNQATYTGTLTGLAGSNSTVMSLWVINGGTSAQLNGTNLNNTFDLIMTVTYRA